MPSSTKLLACCAQACWTLVEPTLAAHLDLPAEQMVFCGLALGHADPAHPVNTLRTARAEVSEFAAFRGFDTSASPARSPATV